MEYAISQKDLAIIDAKSLEKYFAGLDRSKPFEKLGLLCPVCLENVHYAGGLVQGPHFRHYHLISDNFISHVLDCPMREGTTGSQGSTSSTGQDRKILVEKIWKAYLNFGGLFFNNWLWSQHFDEELKTEICSFFEQKLGPIKTPDITKKRPSKREIENPIKESFFKKKKIFAADIENSLKDADDKLQNFWGLTTDKAQKVIDVAKKAVRKDSHSLRVWLAIRFIIYSQDLLARIILHALEYAHKQLGEQQLKIQFKTNRKRLVRWLYERILERICLIDWDSVWRLDINLSANLPVNLEEPHFLRLFKGRYTSKSTNPKFCLKSSPISENFSKGFPIKIERCPEKGVVLKLYAKHHGFLENGCYAVVPKCISSLAIKDGLVTFNIDDANLQELYKYLYWECADDKLYGVEEEEEELYLNDYSRWKGADSPLKGKFQLVEDYFPAYFDYVVLPHTDILEELYKPLLHESNDPVVKLWIIAMMAYKSHQPIQVLYKENEQDWILPDEYSHELLIFPQIIVGNMM